MRPLGWLCLAAVLASACSAGEDEVAEGQDLRGRLVIFAASSLTESFKAIGEAFEGAHPGATVEFSFASSSALATQIEQGAPVDLFASADATQMQRLVDGRRIEGTPQPFARNSLVVIVPAANRAALRTPADLARPGVKLVLAAPDVPVGAYARDVLARLGAQPGYPPGFEAAALNNVVSNEANVRAVLAKVELGEADAGIVYRTDARVAASRVDVLELPSAANISVSYPIAAVTDGKTALAHAFIEYLRGPEAQAVLRAARFEPVAP